MHIEAYYIVAEIAEICHYLYYCMNYVQHLYLNLIIFPTCRLILVF